MAKIISGHHLVGTTKNHVTATSEKSSCGRHLKPWCGHHVWRGDFAFVLLPVGFRLRILPISEIRFWWRGHSMKGPVRDSRGRVPPVFLNGGGHKMCSPRQRQKKIRKISGHTWAREGDVPIHACVPTHTQTSYASERFYTNAGSHRQQGPKLTSIILASHRLRKECSPNCCSWFVASFPSGVFRNPRASFFKFVIGGCS